MMYMHYCQTCHRIHMLNGHRMSCPRCESKLTELRISYLEFVNLDIAHRDDLRMQCEDKKRLKEISTTYRMYKYSKWFKKLQREKAAAESNAKSKVNTQKGTSTDAVTNEQTR